jgi:hypothetical protein
MTERDAFTADQWRSLIDVAPAIARAVAVTVGSASQTVGELGAFVKLVDRTASDDPGGLLGAIVSDLHGRLAGGMPAERPVDPFMNGIEAARIAGAILSIEADPSDGDRARGSYPSHRWWPRRRGRAVSSGSVANMSANTSGKRSPPSATRSA